MPAGVGVLIMVAAAFLGPLGLLTRPATLGIAIVMLGRIVTVHRQHGFFMNWVRQPAG